ncbi:MAG: fibro-slime domain-containing protein, partial [Chitinivibrionales bacterium]
FVYLPGSQISFSSDDHLWVFIEGHLVFDNGSAHANPASSLSLDSLARARSIHPGQTCSFDLFYAQRNLSSPRLSFSIPRCKESHLTLQEQIAAQPSPSEYAFRLTADIYCDTTLLLSPGGYFFWGLVDQFSNPGRFLNSTFGDGSVEVGLPYTHASQGVWVLYWNTQTGTFLSDTITVTAPNPPYVDYHIRLSDGTVAPERVEIEKGVLCTLRAWAKNTETEEYEGPLPARWLIDNTGLDLEYSPEHVLIISPYDTGTSTVYITDTSKYIHSDPIEILVKQTATSLKASSHKLHEELFHITPTTATIHTPQEWQSCRIRIIKPNGAAVFDVTSQKHQVRLPIRQLPAGVYFVTVQNRAARKVHRLVIKE